MNKLKNTILYIIKHYPYENDLTQTKLIALLYLIDWENTLRYKKQPTNISWYFDHYGPYASDVINEVNNHNNLYVEPTKSNFSTEKYLIKSKTPKDQIKIIDLTKEDTDIINKVINDTKLLTWNELMTYVYNTKPIKNTKKYTNITLENYI